MKSGRKGNRFPSRRSIEENGSSARIPPFPRKKKNARETFIRRIARALFEVVGRRGLEPRTNCLKGNCSTIELASRPKLFAETKSEEEDAFFPRERQAFFFLPENENFSRAFPPRRKTLPREFAAGAFFSFFAEAKNYAQKIRISSCAVSTRRNIVSG